MPSQIKMLENIQPSQMEIPSQLLLKWSIMYMFYISRNLLRFFSMEIPSQLLLKWSTCSTSVLMISYEIRKSLESKNSHSAHQSTYLSQNGTNWGFLHNVEVHHNYCETCKYNLYKKPGDLCPLCDSPIDLVVKKCHIELNYSCD